MAVASGLYFSGAPVYSANGPMFISRLVLKLGLVRFATSLLVVLLANVLNRVLIVDLMVPAALVTFSFAFQHVMTPVGLVTGYFSDTHPFRGRHRAPYIWGGMLLSVAVMPFFPDWALEMGAQPHSRALLYQGVLLFSLFGIGTTVSATAINALLVDRVPEPDRGGALTMVWILTLLGFIVGSALTGVLFPAFDPAKIQELFGVVTLVVVAVTFWGAWGIEPRCQVAPNHQHGQMQLWPTLKFLASNRQALAFFAFLGTTIFFLAIQTFLLTAYGGEVLALPVAETSRFGVYTTYGILAGMVGVHVLLSLRHNWGNRVVLAVSLVMGAAAFGLLSLTSFRPDPTWGIYALCLLGLARGFYNVGLSHLTMSMAHPTFSGIFMGLWNLASGLALAAGEMAGGFLKDRLVAFSGSQAGAYGWVFLLEGVGLLACLLFLVPLSLKKYRPQLAVLVAEEKMKSY
jgi:BCD family chlorophyll transporter-like MFS transporter